MKEKTVKLFKDISTDKVIHYIIIIVASLIAGIPLINFRIYGTDDGFIHILRIYGLEKILTSGVFPPTICSSFGNGFGYAINLFYAPLVSYGPLIFRIFTSQYTICLKLFTFTTILISGFTMYNFMYEVFKKREIAIFGAVIYIFIPYRLETIYNRFAIGEFTSYIFIPILFQGLYNLVQGDGKKHYYIAISVIGLVLTHTISTEYSAIFALLYMILNLPRLKNKEIWKKIAINLIFILLVTAFFTIPLIEHNVLGNYWIFNSDAMRSLPIDVQGHTIEIWQLFKDKDEVEGVSFKLGWFLILFSVIGTALYKKIKNNFKSEYLTFVLIAIISLAMSTKYFPWLAMPKILTTIQFAWRNLMFFEFSLAIICSINLYALVEIIAKGKENLYNILVPASILLIILSMAQINYNYNYESAKTQTDADYESNIKSTAILSIWKINREYLPENIVGDPGTSYIDLREDGTVVLTGEATIKNENKNGLEDEFSIENAKSETILELPYIYYLGYNVTMEQNGVQTNLETFESENGFVAIKIQEDVSSANIKVKYTGTVLEYIAYVISEISVIAFICYIIRNNRKNKPDEKTIK